MKRISEALAFQTVLAPQSVAASTDKTTAYVDVSGVEEIVFLVSAAALGKGKGLTVSLLASGDSGGDGAEEIGKTTFTDSVGTAPQLAVVTYKVSALNGRYVAVQQYDLSVNFMVLRDFDLREATITGTIVNDNPAFRRLLTQLKLTEPDVSNLDTSGGGEV